MLIIACTLWAAVMYGTCIINTANAAAVPLKFGYGSVDPVPSLRDHTFTVATDCPYTCHCDSGERRHDKGCCANYYNRQTACPKRR